MTKQEAIKALKDGHKVRHAFFTENEYIMQSPKNPDNYLTEDGYEIPASEFWAKRNGTSFLVAWDLFTATPSPLPETDNEIRQKSLNWWTSLDKEVMLEMKNRYFPDRELLTADERLHIYLSETGVSIDTPTEAEDWDLYPGNEAGAFDHLDNSAEDLEIEELEKYLFDEPTGTPASETETGVSTIEKAADDFAKNGFDFDLGLTGTDYDKRCEAFIKGAQWQRNNPTPPTPGNEREGEGFTPGPWKCKPISNRVTNNNRSFEISGFETGNSVRDVLPKEVEATARLIASAPDMYRALKNLLSVCIHASESHIFRKEIEEGEAILNSITGGK